MESATPSTRDPESRNHTADGADHARHRPFKSWALQQDLNTLLGNEPALEGDRTALDDGTAEFRGQRYLREQLQNNPEFGLRAKTSAALWASALVTFALNQWGPIGVKMDTDDFTVSFVAIAIGLAIAAVAYPLLKPRAFLIVEQFVVTYAFAIIAYQCSLTGGADSPFALWVVFAVFYAAYFMSKRGVQFQTLLGMGVAVAPIFYEPDKTSTNAALFALLIAAIAYAISYTVFYRRQLSRNAERAVKFLALADPLTSTANLRSFEQFAQQLTNRLNGNFAITMVDMNGLKGANSVFGYDVGDDMVARLARLMLEVSSPEDQVARIGGDEFAVLMPGSGTHGADNWRVRFDAAVAKHNASVRGRLPQISVATGTAEFPADGANADELIDAADRRMYKQKSPAVTPPHVVDEASPVRASRLIHNGYAFIAPKRAFNRRRFSKQAGYMWLLTGAFVLAWPLLPGSVVPHPTATLFLGLYCWLISAISFAGRFKPMRRYGWRVADIATLTIAAPGLWLTAGTESPFQLAGILVVAYYAQYYRGTAAFGRIGTVIGLYSLAFWTSGVVSASAQTLFVTVVTAEIVIATIMQLNARAIDRSLAVIRVSATRDALTGAQNLHAFRGDLAAATADRQTDQEAHLHRPALIIADLDSFRDINTQAGHRGGDAVLREAVRRLETACSKAGTVYRIGGDEFAVLFTVDRIGDAAALAKRCRRALQFVPPAQLGIEGQVTASVGFSVFRDEMSGEAFVSAVEEALSESKRKPGDSVGADTNVML